MTSIVMLDTGPLGKIAHPRPSREIAKWLKALLDSGAIVIVPEIADYEVRRNLLLEGLTDSVARLDQLKTILTYLPLNTRVMLRAAGMWADARKRGSPATDMKSLDGDVILAAQAESTHALVATENVRHLSWFVQAKHWTQVS